MANPLSNVKDLYKMQREAQAMQKKLREKVLSGESKDGRVRLHMNAAQEFVDINIDDSLLSPEEFETLKTGMSQAFKDYQKKLQKEMMKDMDLDSLRGMLGG
ncbi:YbaB/EbfC family nucleoid-associated protein [Candidatus Dojkabacteria bacterium]|uniref:YbaB/EbfC family nucleoid-associated protein n=1 Tax=Candidatus Dojkabacteria bacterium TaxID=2099670 RepID=A0A955KW99_9BACT|nr:YbaB/EbfC family nucleoid-associated protein [Candidatus Dojkabacteria bacterium]